MHLIDDRSGLEVVAREECLRLLGRFGVGRVAVVDGGQPAIFPVNYIVEDEQVLFRTAAGTKFDAAVRGQVVAFEIDDADPAHRTGWSVVVVGRAEEVTDAERLESIGAGRLRPWARGAKDHVVAIHGERITGRRIVPVAPGDR